MEDKRKENGMDNREIEELTEEEIDQVAGGDLTTYLVCKLAGSGQLPDSYKGFKEAEANLLSNIKNTLTGGNKKN